MATYHPVTLTENDGEKGASKFDYRTRRLQGLSSYYFISKCRYEQPSIDRYSRKRYRDKNLERVHLFQSLGQLNYLSLLKHSKLVIGNSSWEL